MAALIWKPLRTLPADIKTVYFCADDVLSQIPWAALPGSKQDSVLLEEYTFALVPHGSYLIEQFTAKASDRKDKRTLLAVGGVDYEQVPGAVDARDRRAPARREEGHLAQTARHRAGTGNPTFSS